MLRKLLLITVISSFSVALYAEVDLLYYNRFNPYASTYNSLSVLENPAIFGLLNDNQFSLYYLESYNLNSKYCGSVLEFGKFGLGINYYDTDKGEFLRYSLPFGFRAGDYMLVGAGLSLFDPIDVDYSVAWDWYVGAYFFPVRFLSISVMGQNLGQPSIYNTPLRRRMNLGVGIKPFSEMLEIYADFSFVEHHEDVANRYVISLNPLKGMRLFYGITDNKDMYGGINLDLTRFGVGFVGGYSDIRSGYDGKGFQFRYSARRYEELFTVLRQVIVVRLDDTISDSVREDIFGINKQNRSVLDIINDIKFASKDNSVTGMVLYISNPSISLADAYEIREAIQHFRGLSKRVIAFMEMGDDLSYFIANAADKIILNEGGSLYLKGVSSQMLFFRGFLEKIGVKFDVVSVGEYKTAFEPLTMERASERWKEQSSRLTKSIGKILDEAIISSRHMDSDSLSKIYSVSLFSPDKALEYRLVDSVSTFSYLTDNIKTYFGESCSLNMEYTFYSRIKNIWQLPRRIAIIYLNGDIVYGKGFGDSIGIMNIGNTDIAEIAEDIIEDDTIAGVIVRINSPGGSTTASQLIFEELLRIKRYKPVVVSVGKISASGGYFAAIASDYIIADRTSLVGSIGVFFLKPDLSGLLKKLGINYEVSKTSPGSDSDSLFRGLEADEVKNIENYINDFYKYFKERVVESRKIGQDKIDAIAGGKVYTGEEAFNLGLVDEIGGYEEAIQKIKALAKMSSDMEPEFVEFYKKRDLGSMVMNEESAIISIVKALLKGYSLRDFVEYRFF